MWVIYYFSSFFIKFYYSISSSRLNLLILKITVRYVIKSYKIKPKHMKLLFQCGCRDLNPRHELGKLACYQATPHPLRTLIVRIVINFRFNDLSDSLQCFHTGKYFPAYCPYGQFIVKYGNWVQFLVYRTYKITLRETSYKYAEIGFPSE